MRQHRGSVAVACKAGSRGHVMNLEHMPTGAPASSMGLAVRPADARQGIQEVTAPEHGIPCEDRRETEGGSDRSWQQFFAQGPFLPIVRGAGYRARGPSSMRRFRRQPRRAQPRPRGACAPGMSIVDRSTANRPPGVRRPMARQFPGKLLGQRGQIDRQAARRAEAGNAVAARGTDEHPGDSASDILAGVAHQVAVR